MKGDEFILKDVEMECCQCEGIETEFGSKEAGMYLKRYRSKGAYPTTQILLNILKAAGVEGMSLLDIGGGFDRWRGR